MRTTRKVEQKSTMKLQDKASTVVVALFLGAVLILGVVPLSLRILRSMSNGIGFELPYILWIALYISYAFGILASASDGSLFKESKRKGFGSR